VAQARGDRSLEGRGGSTTRPPYSGNGRTERSDRGATSVTRQGESCKAPAGIPPWRETGRLSIWSVSPIPEPFAITTSREGNWAVIALIGELCLENVELLDQAIRSAETGDSERIILDLRELSFMDSMGLTVLLQAHERCDRISFIPSKQDGVARLIAVTGTEGALGYPSRRVSR
jgi:anti-sigma B factor antagonist